MRKAVLLTIMMLAGVLGIRAQRTWVNPSPSAYASHESNMASKFSLKMWA